MDGLAGSYWQSSPLTDPEGQWVEVRFTEPTPLDRISVRAGVDGFTGAPVRRVRVDAGDQSRTADVDPSTGLVEVGLDGRPVDRVRVTVTGVAGTDGVVALREISFPGLDIGRRLVVPTPGTADTTFVLRARPPRRGCIDAGLGVSCGYSTDARVGEEESGMVRDLTVTEDGRWSFDGEVVARATSATQRAPAAHPREHPRPGVLDLPRRAQPGRAAGLRRRSGQLLGGLAGRRPPDAAAALAAPSEADLARRSWRRAATAMAPAHAELRATAGRPGRWT